MPDKRSTLDNSEATLLLKNLLARLDADAAAERPQFRAVVSDDERDALWVLLGLDDSGSRSHPEPNVIDPPHPPKPEPKPKVTPPEPKPPEPAAGKASYRKQPDGGIKITVGGASAGMLRKDSDGKLRLSREGSKRFPSLAGKQWASEVGAKRAVSKAALKEPEPVILRTDALRADVAPEWVLCLDFGTAKSKAFAATDDEEEPELEPLPIGEADGDLDGSVYEVSSCVWIDDDGRLFVGSEAVKRGMNHGGDSRRPLDSLKQEISQVDPENGAAELDRKLPEEVDPTATLTCADAITFYLAYLTHLATEAVARRARTPYVRRRFTVPCWQSTQRGWAAELLGRRLLRAQLLADTFRGRWREGIPVEQIAFAVQAAAAHEVKLRRLAAAEPDDVSHWFRGSLEALAAASARMWMGRFERDLMLVVDVGAGTTDLSLFWVVQDGERHRAFPIVDGNSCIRQAGDTLDRALVEALLQRAGLGNDEAGVRARRGLRRKGVRRLKETLFRVGSLTETLVNDAEVTLSREEFIDSERVKSFEERIAREIQRLLENVHESWGKAAAKKGVTLVLTGGGCDLPMITALKDRSWRLSGRAVPFRVARRVPRSVEDRFDAPFIQVYPRLAVAMGGALKTQLDERIAWRVWRGETSPPGPLGRYAVTG